MEARREKHPGLAMEFRLGDIQELELLHRKLVPRILLARRSIASYEAVAWQSGRPPDTPAPAKAEFFQELRDDLDPKPYGFPTVGDKAVARVLLGTSEKLSLGKRSAPGKPVDSQLSGSSTPSENKVQVVVPSPDIAPPARSEQNEKRTRGNREIPASERHYYRCRAVAELLLSEKPEAMPLDLVTNREFDRFGCQGKAGYYGEGILLEWIRDLTKTGKRTEQGSLEGDQRARGTSGTKQETRKTEVDLKRGPNTPALTMRPYQRHAERCKAIAGLLWFRGKDYTVLEMKEQPEIKHIACEGINYKDRFFFKHFKEIRPKRKPGPRPVKQSPQKPFPHLRKESLKPSPHPFTPCVRGWHVLETPQRWGSTIFLPN